MGGSDLTSRVSREACVLGVALTAPAAWLGGVDGALGAAAGAGIAVANFRWLASRVSATLRAASAQRPGGALAAVLRLAALAAAVALLLASGHANPIAIVVGLSVIPITVVVEGLRTVRDDA
jgi:hypothetical protein